MVRCSICHTLLQPSDAMTVCSECKQEYHTDCWNEIGGCGTYGCKAAATPQKPPPPARVGGGWGDTKECPACGKAIGSGRIVCTCGVRFPWADPMTREEFAAWRAKEDSLSMMRKVLVALFVLSILGPIAPLSGAVAGTYAFFKRTDLAGPGGTYLALGYGSAALGALYAIIMLFLAIGW